MPAGYYNFDLDQGSSFNTSINLSDQYGTAYNLTNFLIKCKAKKSYIAANATIIFNTSIIDASNGIIQLTANSASTSNCARGKLVYDVLIIDPSNNVTRVLEGQIYVSPAVSL